MALASDRLGRGVFEFLPWWLVFFMAPVLLCIVVGWRTDQWSMRHSGVAQAGAAAWCVVAPILAFPLFLSFMCLAFNSCFGD